MIIQSREIEIPVEGIRLDGSLNIVEGSDGVIVFAHGSGSSRHSSRNKFVANVFQKAGFSTLLFDLLTVHEGQDYARRFEIPLITDRLIKVTEWLKTQSQLAELSVGYFGASTGAAAAVGAAAELYNTVKAVVSRGGRPDLAPDALPHVKAPTLLMVGSLDYSVLELNQRAHAMLQTEKKLLIIEGATHLFEEAGKLDEVARHASDWFAKYLKIVFA